jgi:hypothetical protein
MASDIDKNTPDISNDEMQHLLEILPDVRKNLDKRTTLLESGDFTKEYLDPTDVLEAYESMLSDKEKAVYGDLQDWNAQHPDKKRYLFFVTVRAPGKAYGTAKKFWIEAPDYEAAKKKLVNKLTSQKLELVQVKNEDLLKAMESGFTEEDKKKREEDKILLRKQREEEKKQKEEERHRPKVKTPERDVFVEEEDVPYMSEEEIAQEQEEQAETFKKEEPLGRTKEDISEIVKNILYKDIQRGKK